MIYSALICDNANFKFYENNLSSPTLMNDIFDGASHSSLFVTIYTGYLQSGQKRDKEEIIGDQQSENRSHELITIATFIITLALCKGLIKIVRSIQ